MSKQVIIRELWVVILLFGWLIGCTVKIIWKKSLFTHLRFSETTNKIINIILIPFVYFCLLFSLSQCIAVVHDIPSIIEKKYSIDKATVMTTSVEKKGLIIGRHVYLEINGETEKYRLYSKEVYKGEEIMVAYLPYSNVAQIINESE